MSEKTDALERLQEHLAGVLRDLQALHPLSEVEQNRLSGLRDWSKAQVASAVFEEQRAAAAARHAEQLVNHAEALVKRFGVELAGVVVDRLPVTLPLLPQLLELPIAAHTEGCDCPDCTGAR